MCSFDDPVVTDDLVAISDKLLAPLRIHKLKVQIALWLVIPAILIPLLVLDYMGVPLSVAGGQGTLLMILAPWPLIGLMLCLILAEKRVRRKVYREEGLYCLSCGKVPTDSKKDDFEDWIAWRSCPHCEGRLKRFETERIVSLA